MSSQVSRHVRVLLVVGLALAGWSLVFMTPASAHTSLAASTPRAGQVLGASPGAITLTFSDPVDQRTAAIHVLEPTGLPMAGLGAPTLAAGSGRVLTAKLPGTLADGTRTVTWRVVSSDGHPLQGSFTFSVGVAKASAAPDALQGGRQLEDCLGVARWVAFIGIALTIGTLLLVFLGWPAGLGEPAVRRVLVTGLAAVGLASAVSLLLYGPYLAGTGLQNAFADLDLAVHTRVGRLLVARLALLAGLVGGLAVWLRRSAPFGPGLHGRVGPAATLCGVVALALTWSAAGHGGSGDRLALPVDLAHLLAMGAWIGGMPALLVLLLKVRDAEALARVVPIFSRTAAVCLLTLLGTGVIQSWRQVGSVDALVSTPYGGWLIAKLALVGLIVALGAAARWWVVPRLLAPVRAGRRRRRAPGLRLAPPAARRLGRVVALETALGALILAVTAALVSTQPASAVRQSERTATAAGPDRRDVVAAPVQATIGFRLARVAAGAAPAEFAPPPVGPGGPPSRRGWAQAVITPAMGGLPNELHLAVTSDAKRPLRLDAAFVQLRSADGGQRSTRQPLRSVGTAHYLAPFTVPGPGRWQLVITVRGAGGQAALVVPFHAAPAP